MNPRLVRGARRLRLFTLRLPWLLAAALLGPPSGTALANPAARARYFDAQARSALAQGRTEEALKLFLRSHQASPSGLYAFNIAVVALEAGDTELAYAYLRDYQASGDQDPARRAHAETTMKQLVRELALIHVSGEPAGATLYVDKRSYGSFGQSPRTLAVSPGRHKLLVEKEGFIVQALEFEAVRGKTERVAFSLPVLQGQLTVNSPVGETAIAIDRAGVRTALPVGQTVNLPIGDYQIEVETSGYYTATANARVDRDRPSRLTLTPQLKLEARGAVLIETALAGVKVYVDNELYAYAPVRVPELPVGQHSIELVLDGREARLPGYKQTTGSTARRAFGVTISEGITLTLRPTFERKQTR